MGYLDDGGISHSQVITLTMGEDMWGGKNVEEGEGENFWHTGHGARYSNNR